jgi:hypothetical protein
MRAGLGGVKLLYCTYLETVVGMSITFLFLVALHTYYSRVLGLVGDGWLCGHVGLAAAACSNAVHG